MRRSAAPSQRLNGQRKPLQIRQKVTLDTEKPNMTPKNSGNRRFSILWNKLSTKKHKTWAGDGFLEVRENNVATARDANGIFIGSSQINPEKLFSGSQIVFGGKEIEIQEEVSSIAFEKPAIVDDELLKLHVPKLANKTDETISKKPKLQTDEPQNLRPHQIEGVEFIKSCIMGTKNPNYFGVILADEMGLGKTLQCLSVCKSLLKPNRVLQRILIVTPSSLTGNWNNEINKWLKKNRLFAYIVEGRTKIKDYSNQLHLPFVIVSYEMLLSNLEDFKQVHFDLLILDEGHRLKNKSTKLVQGLEEFKIVKKILLTGTPIQNNLQEFYSLVDFVNPGILGTYSEFKRNFENPISASQCPQADEDVIEEGRFKTDQLNEISNNFILRRTQEINKKFLPKKHEFVIFVEPSELQQIILKTTVDLWNKYKNDVLQDLTPLQIIGILSKICNHPSLITRTTKDNILTRNLAKHLPKWNEMGPFDSGKLGFVQTFLENLQNKNKKLVLVSNYTKTLDMLQGLCDHLEMKSLRLDGSVPAADRNAIVKKFSSPEYSVFLLSSKAGGVGLNLSAASNLILFDSDWNPAVDSQAMSRIWRDGQKEDVRIYRLITCGTIEEKVFQRQIRKLSFGIVMKENCQYEVKFSKDDLEELFVVDPRNFLISSTHESMKCNESNEICRSGDWTHYQRPFTDKFVKDTEIIEEGVLLVFSKNNFFE